MGLVLLFEHFISCQKFPTRPQYYCSNICIIFKSIAFQVFEQLSRESDCWGEEIIFDPIESVVSRLDDVVNESIIVCAIGKYSSYFPGSAVYFIAYAVSFTKAITRIVLDVEPSSGYSYITICSASMFSLLKVSMILYRDYLILSWVKHRNLLPLLHVVSSTWLREMSNDSHRSPKYF